MDSRDWDPRLPASEMWLFKINKSSMNRWQKKLERAWLSVGKDSMYLCEIFKRKIWLGVLGKET